MRICQLFERLIRAITLTSAKLPSKDKFKAIVLLFSTIHIYGDVNWKALFRQGRLIFTWIKSVQYFFYTLQFCSIAIVWVWDIKIVYHYYIEADQKLCWALAGKLFPILSSLIFSFIIAPCTDTGQGDCAGWELIDSFGQYYSMSLCTWKA